WSLNPLNLERCDWSRSDDELRDTRTHTQSEMSRKIMVVDDDPQVRVTFEFHLLRSGFQVLCAETAEEALSKVHEFDPDVVITDLQMPGMDGIELLRKINAAGANADVIVITAYEGMRSTITAVKEGAYDYLV